MLNFKNQVVTTFHSLLVIAMLFSSHIIYADPSVSSGGEAIKKGDMAALKEYLQDPNADLNGHDKNGETLLHISINFHNLEAQDLLLQQEEIDPNRGRGDDATPPLAMAVSNRLFRGYLRSDLPPFSESKSLEAINALLRHPKTDPNKGGAFVNAAWGRDLNVVRSFLKYRGGDLSQATFKESVNKAILNNSFDTAIEILRFPKLEISDSNFQDYRHMVRWSDLSFKEKRTLNKLLKNKKKSSCY